MTEKVESELDRAYAQVKAMGEEIARWQAFSAKQLEEYGKLAAQVDLLEEEKAQAAREIDRLRGQVRELMAERNTLQDMARAAAKFGDLGGER